MYVRGCMLYRRPFISSLCSVSAKESDCHGNVSRIRDKVVIPLTHLMDEHGKNAGVDQGLEGVDKRDASLARGV